MGKPRVISLFSGAGGIDYGLEAAGFLTCVAVEMDSDCCVTLRANRPWNVIERDIALVPTEEILATAGLRRGEADLLVGGPPCQPFSKSGYWARGDALRLDDPRAGTLHAYMRVVEESLPRAFLLENVPGLAYSGKDEGLQHIMKLLDGLNRRTNSAYRPVVCSVNAVNYGVPQVRQRVFIIAARDGAPFSLPVSTHHDTRQDGLPLESAASEPFRTAWDALADVAPPADEDLRLTGKWADLLPSIPEGQNYLFHTSRGDGMPLFGWRRRYWSFLLKLAKNRPSWTLQAQPGPATGPFHWDNRLLSMRELCRLQTFPDDVQIMGGRRAIQSQVGNAVPSLLAEVLGRAIRTQYFGAKRRPEPLALLPARRRDCPKPRLPTPVPRTYLSLRGEHSDHPGTGMGARAQAT